MSLRFLATLFVAVAVAVLSSACEELPTDVLLQRAETALQEKKPRDAMLDLRTVLRAEPTNVKARWMLAELYIQGGDGASAEKETRRAGDLGVDQDSVLPMLAKALLMQGKFADVVNLTLPAGGSAAGQAELLASQALAYLALDDGAGARRALDQAASLASDTAYVRYARAREIWADEGSAAAIVTLEKLVSEWPEFAPAWSLLGQLHATDKQYAAAEAAFSQAMQYRLLATSDRLDRGYARLAMKDLEGAGQDLRVMQKLAPEHPKVRLLAGLLHLENQQYELAKDELTVALGKAPNELWVVLALGKADAALGNHNQAMALAERAYAIAPDNVDARKSLAGYRLRSGDYAEVERLMRPIVREFPQDIEAQRMLVASLIFQNRNSEVVTVVQRVAEQHKESVETQVWAGVALMAAKQPALGVQALSQASRMAPQGQGVSRMLILALLESDRTEQALRLAESVAAEHPGEVVTQDLLALAYESSGRSADAIAALEQGLAVDEGHVPTVLMLSVLYQRAGQPEAARSLLDRTIDAGGDDPMLLTRRAALAKTERDDSTFVGQLQRLIENEPENLAPRIELARHYLEHRRYQSASDVLSDVALSEDADALLLKGVAERMLGALSEAQAAFEKLAGLDPNDADVLLELAKIYAAAGDRGRLDRVIERLAVIRPDDDNVSAAVAKLFARDGKPNRAEDVLRDSGLPANAATRLSAELAIATARGDVRAALDKARRLYEAESEARNVVLLSRALVAATQTRDAVEVLRDWLASNPADVRVMTELVGLLKKQPDRAAYLEQLRKILDIDPDSVFALNNLAWEIMQSAPADSLGLAERAYALAPQSAEVMDTLGMSLAANSRFENALRFVTKAIDAEPRSTVYRLHKVEVLRTAGDLDGAEAELQRLRREPLSAELRAQVEGLLDEIGRLRERAS